MNYYSWINKNLYSLKNKVVAVSGATGGIGTELCDYLAYLGAELICLDRNAEKSNKLISVLKIKYPTLIAQHVTLDLEDMENVKFVVDFLNNYGVDYVILNAGAYKIPRHTCTTGYDNVFQINFISPYYIANKLALHVKKRNGRVVAVSSIAHNYSKIDSGDVDFSTRIAASKVYGNAKRFLTYSLFNFFKDEDTLSVVHPGITLTNITNHYPKLLFSIIKHPMKVIFMSPKKAALSVLYGVYNNCSNNEWIGPRLFNVWGLPRKKKLHTATLNESAKIYDIATNIFNSL